MLRLLCGVGCAMLIAAGGACRSDDGDAAPASGGSAGTGTGGQSGTEGGAGTGGAGGGSNGFGGDSSCVGNVVWAAPSKSKYTFGVTVTDFQAQLPVAGASVKLCALSDPDCLAPLMTETTDVQGKVTLTAQASQQGIAAYLDISGADLAPTLEFLRFSDNTTLDGGDVNVTVLSAAARNLFMTLIQTTPDPTRGTLTFAATDCSLAPLAGVSASIDTADPSTVTAYLAGGVPSKSATATDEGGYAGFVNVPPGAVKLTGKGAKTGALLGQLELHVRAGYNSQTRLPATP